MDSSDKEALEKIAMISEEYESVFPEELIPMLIFVSTIEKPGCSFTLKGPCTPKPSKNTSINPEYYQNFLKQIDKMDISYRIDLSRHPGLVKYRVGYDRSWIYMHNITGEGISDHENMGHFYGYPKDERERYSEVTRSEFEKFVEKSTNFSVEELKRCMRFVYYTPLPEKESLYSAILISNKRSEILKNLNTYDYPNLSEAITEQLSKHERIDAIFTDESVGDSIDNQWENH